jgi:hypothetical protein
VHIFHCMRKEAILLLHIQENNLANYSQRLSIISKQSKLILKELRYQEKIHAIICYAKKKNHANSPQFFFLIIIIKNCNMEKHLMQGKIKPDDANTERQSLDLLFLSSHK